MWREDAIALLLAEDDARPLFLAGCKSNQGRFYPQLTAVVLLTAPLETLLDRIAHRDTNPYGKSDEERALVVDHVATVEPLLRRTATHVVDATAPVPTIVEQLEAIAATSGSRRTRMAHGSVTATAGVTPRPVYLSAVARPRYPKKGEPLPPPLPPASRTVGQVVAEAIALYRSNFAWALALGLPVALADQVLSTGSIVGADCPARGGVAGVQPRVRGGLRHSPGSRCRRFAPGWSRSPSAW